MTRDAITTFDIEECYFINKTRGKFVNRNTTAVFLVQHNFSFCLYNNTFFVIHSLFAQPRNVGCSYIILTLNYQLEKGNCFAISIIIDTVVLVIAITVIKRIYN